MTSLRTRFSTGFRWFIATMLTGFAGAVPTVKGAGYGSLKARSHGFADPEVLVKRQSKAYLGGWTISVFAAETRWPGELQIRLDV